MIKILFVCYGSTADSRELAALVGQITAIGAGGGYYGFTTSEETKKELVFQAILRQLLGLIVVQAAIQK